MDMCPLEMDNCESLNVDSLAVPWTMRSCHLWVVIEIDPATLVDTADSKTNK